MRSILAIIIMLITLTVHGQGRGLTYQNDKNAYYNKSNLRDSFFEPHINEITLKPDSTFEFWSRPHSSCFTWHQYKGSWKKEMDTIRFYDSYEIFERDSQVAYQKDSKPSYRINFSTDKNSVFRNKRVKVQYIYDYDAHLEDVEKEFQLNESKALEIPFQDIPNLSKLAAIKTECQLDGKGKRISYLTENKFINIKTRDLSNIISVMLVEDPKEEVVHRTIKGVIKNDTLRILSTTKTKTIMQDYYQEIMFEDSYALYK